jgi:DnaJ-class molecular chaperone
MIIPCTECGGTGNKQADEVAIPVTIDGVKTFTSLDQFFAWLTTVYKVECPTCQSSDNIQMIGCDSCTDGFLLKDSESSVCYAPSTLKELQEQIEQENRPVTLAESDGFRLEDVPATACSD